MDKKLSDIIEIVSSSTGIPKEKLNLNSNSSDFSKWDSLSQIKIIDKFEKKTKEKVKISQFAKFNSIKSILKIF